MLLFLVKVNLQFLGQSYSFLSYQRSKQCTLLSIFYTPIRSNGVSGVENRQGCSLLLYLKLLVKEYEARSFLSWWGEVWVPLIQNSLVKLGKGEAETDCSLLKAS